MSIELGILEVLKSSCPYVFGVTGLILVGAIFLQVRELVLTLLYLDKIGPHAQQLIQLKSSMRRRKSTAFSLSITVGLFVGFLGLVELYHALAVGESTSDGIALGIFDFAIQTLLLFLGNIPGLLYAWRESLVEERGERVAALEPVLNGAAVEPQTTSCETTWSFADEGRWSDLDLVYEEPSGF